MHIFFLSKEHFLKYLNSPILYLEYKKKLFLIHCELRLFWVGAIYILITDTFISFSYKIIIIIKMPNNTDKFFCKGHENVFKNSNIHSFNAIFFQFLSLIKVFIKKFTT